MRLCKIFAYILTSLCFLTPLYASTSMPNPANTSMPNPANTAQHLDSIVAIVNDDIITSSELNRAISLAKYNIRKAHMNMPPAANLRSAALQQLIDHKLQLQMAQRAKLTISQKQINAYMSAIARHQGLSLNEWKQSMYKQGYNSRTLTQTLKEQILVMQVQKMAVGSTIKLTKSDINKIQQQAQQIGNNAQQYNLKDILVSLPDNPTDNQLTTAKQTAVNAMKTLQANPGSSNIKGAVVNDLGWKNLNQLPALFTRAIKGKKSGQIIGPIQAGNGFHVLQIVNMKANRNAIPSQQQIRQIAMQQKFMQAVTKWVKTLRNNAYIHIN